MVTILENKEGPKFRHFLNIQTKTFQVLSNSIWESRGYYFPFALNPDSGTVPKERQTYQVRKDPKQKHKPLDSFLKKYLFIYLVVLRFSQGKQDLRCDCSKQDLLILSHNQRQFSPFLFCIASGLSVSL